MHNTIATLNLPARIWCKNNRKVQKNILCVLPDQQKKIGMCSSLIIFTFCLHALSSFSRIFKSGIRSLKSSGVESNSFKDSTSSIPTSVR